MDPLIGLFAMEAFGIVDSEAMVKGVCYPSQYVLSNFFFVGALLSKLGHLSISTNISAHFPTEFAHSIALSHTCLGVLPPNLTVIFV